MTSVVLWLNMSKFALYCIKHLRQLPKFLNYQEGMTRAGNANGTCGIRTNVRSNFSEHKGAPLSSYSLIVAKLRLINKLPNFLFANAQYFFTKMIILFAKIKGKPLA